jgi:hypothetical protein
MIPFDIELWLTQDADIDAGGTLPRRLLAILFEPAPIERERKTRPGPLQLHHLSGGVRSSQA